MEILKMCRRKRSLRKDMTAAFGGNFVCIWLYGLYFLRWINETVLLDHFVVRELREKQFNKGKGIVPPQYKTPSVSLLLQVPVKQPTKCLTILPSRPIQCLRAGTRPRCRLVKSIRAVAFFSESDKTNVVCQPIR